MFNKDKIANLDNLIGGVHYINLNNFTGIKGYLKIEGLNLAGSIKLKPAIYAITNIISSGEFHQGCELIESSSGNLGVALAMVCAYMNIPFTCVTDPNTSVAKKTRMKAHGANIVEVTECDENGGYLGTRISYIKKKTESDPNVIWINQYENDFNWKSHETKTACELFTSFHKVDYVFIGVGTAGTLKGIQSYISNNGLKTKIVAVDSVGSVTFGGSSKFRNIPGLGSSVGCYHYDRSLVDHEVYVSEEDTIASCKELSASGLYLGGSTGTIYHVMKSFRKKVGSENIFIGISPDLGESYANVVY